MRFEIRFQKKSARKPAEDGGFQTVFCKTFPDLIRSGMDFLELKGEDIDLRLEGRYDLEIKMIKE